uniref:Uncharacterized protein n=1 Tax=Anguilla anguilla TaxID=7936 RepID=A0A0E9TR65_ANGAN
MGSGPLHAEVDIPSISSFFLMNDVYDYGCLWVLRH